MVMDSDIDKMLSRLAAGQPHPQLAGIEDRVLDGIAETLARQIAIGATIGAACFALVFGVASNVLPSTKARGTGTIAPLGAASPLAPSTLLKDIG